jgi:hypothetical protein
MQLCQPLGERNTEAGALEAPRITGIHLAERFQRASGTFESLKADLKRHGVAVSGRPGDDHCIYFNDPDGHRLQLMFPKQGAALARLWMARSPRGWIPAADNRRVRSKPVVR